MNARLITVPVATGGRPCVDLSLHPVRRGKVQPGFHVDQWHHVHAEAGRIRDWFLTGQGEPLGAANLGQSIRIAVDALDQVEEDVLEAAGLPLPTSDSIAIALRLDHDPDVHWTLKRTIDSSDRTDIQHGLYPALGRLRYLPADLVAQLDALCVHAADGSVPTERILAERAAAFMPLPSWTRLRGLGMLTVRLVSRIALIPEHTPEGGWRYRPSPVVPENPDRNLLGGGRDYFSEAIEAIDGDDPPGFVAAGDELLYLDRPIRDLLVLVRDFNAMPARERAEAIVRQKDERVAGTRLSLSRIEVYGRHVHAYGHWDPEQAHRVAVLFRRHDALGSGRRLLDLAPRPEPVPRAAPEPDPRALDLIASIRAADAAASGGDPDLFDAVPLDLQADGDRPASVDGSIDAPAPQADAQATDPETVARSDQGTGRVPGDGNLIARLNLSVLERPDVLIPRALRSNWDRQAILDEMPASVLRDAPPMEHQLSAFESILDGYRRGARGVLLCHEPGLGKTWTGLAVAIAIRALSGRPVLIVTEPQLVDHWQDQLARWFKSSTNRYLHEATRPGYRATAPAFVLDEMRRHQFTITTWPVLRDMYRTLALVEFSAAILDEVSNCRNIDTGYRHAADLLKADYKLGLTGTPGENHLYDIWSQADLVRPGCLGTLDEFTERYVLALAGPNAQAALDGLRDRLTTGDPPILLHETLEGAGIRLPEMRVHAPRIPMGDEQARTYERQAALQSRNMRKLCPVLRQASIHPHIQSLPAAPTREEARQWLARGAITAYALALLERAYEENHRIVFFTAEVAYAQEPISRALAAAMGLGTSLPCVNGQIERSDRQEAIRAFRQANGFAVLMVTCRTGGRGLDLVGTKVLMHFSRWYNPAVERQASKRIHRLGLAHPVDVHIPTVVHPVLKGLSYGEVFQRHVEAKRLLGIDFLAPHCVDGVAVEEELRGAMAEAGAG